MRRCLHLSWQTSVSTLLALFLVGCSSGNSTRGVDASHHEDGSGDTLHHEDGPLETSAPDPPTLFTDPNMPACKEGLVATSLITGAVDGKAISIEAGGASQLDPTQYSETSITPSILYYPVVLKWTERLAEGQAVPLVGGHIYLDPDDPYSAAYCVLSGDFGPKPLASADSVGRTFLFRVTSATIGLPADGGATVKIDCSGAPVSTALAGCIYRTRTDLP
jgi:hypothetical protein